MLSRSENNKTEYGRLRREATKVIRHRKKNLGIKIANKTKSNPKEFYSYLRNKKAITSKIGPLCLENGEVTIDE